MRLPWLHLNTDSAPGLPPADPPKTEAPAKTDLPPGAPPPVATIASTGTRTEKELELERKLKEREMALAEMQDRNRTLQQRAADQEKLLQGHGTITAPKEKFSWMGFGSDSDEG